MKIQEKVLMTDIKTLKSDKSILLDSLEKIHNRKPDMFKMIETMDMNSTIRLKDAYFINDEETFLMNDTIKKYLLNRYRKDTTGSSECIEFKLSGNFSLKNE